MASSRIGSLIREFVATESAQIGADLAHGSGVDTFKYGLQVGEVSGMKKVIRRIEEIEGEL